MLRPIAAEVRHQAGELVFRRGGPTHSVYFVASGSVRLTRYGPAGEEVVLHEARPGEFLAEASLDSERYHCDAIAGAATTLWKVPAATLREWIERDPAFASAWMSWLARQLRAARARNERLALRSASDRIRHLLLSEGRGPDYEFRASATLKDLARDLALSHESLYRTLARMERDGEIERDGTVLRLPRRDRAI